MKELAKKIGDSHYIVPKFGSMNCDANVFFSDALYEASEREVWNQLVNAASYSGVKASYAMPDAHVGYGVPVGSVTVTENTLIQCAAGYDISCGMILMQVKGLNARGLRSKENRRQWMKEVESRVALGVGIHRPKSMPTFTEEDLEKILRFGPSAIGVKTDVCERSFLPVSDRFNSKLIERAYKSAIPQIGSLGGGNHFIELQCDAEDGTAWVMVHTGSRGYGYQTAEHFFYKGAEARGLPKNRRESSWVYVDEDVGREYWDYHNSAGNYASANRHMIARSVSEAIEKVYNAECVTLYEISHNLVQEETLPDGTKGFVHRKGATRAFPVNDLNLQGAGHPCLIPGSMYEGAAVLTPLPGSSKSGFSVNHGSGRVLGRKDAKRKLGHKQLRIDEQMEKVLRNFGEVGIEGVLVNTRHVPIDECNEVYKSLDHVLAVLENEGIAKIVRRLYPVACIKGND